MSFFSFWPATMPLSDSFWQIFMSFLKFFYFIAKLLAMLDQSSVPLLTPVVKIIDFVEHVTHNVLLSIRISCPFDDINFTL
jgi:hypothetical protein